MGNANLPMLGAGDEYQLRAPDPDLGNWDAKTEQWRLQRYLDIGFTLDDAERLALGRTWPGHVEAWLAAGCAPATAVAIAT